MGHGDQSLFRLAKIGVKSALYPLNLVVSPPLPLGLRHRYVEEGSALELGSDTPVLITAPSTQQELRDCWWPSCSKSQYIYSVTDLEKIPSLLASVSFSRKGWGWLQGTSRGDLCGTGPNRRPRHLPWLR